MKRWNKSGQFYLLAAILIITAILGFVTVNNYSQGKTPLKIYDLGKELGIEGGKVLEYGVLHKNPTLEETFVGNFSIYGGENKEIFFIFGSQDSTGINVISSKEIAKGKVGLGDSQINIQTKEIVRNDDETVCQKESDRKIRCTLYGQEYDFSLREGDNFYFIISQQVGEEQHVTTG